MTVDSQPANGGHGKRTRTPTLSQENIVTYVQDGLLTLCNTTGDLATGSHSRERSTWLRSLLRSALCFCLLLLLRQWASKDGTRPAGRGRLGGAARSLGLRTRREHVMLLLLRIGTGLATTAGLLLAGTAMIGLQRAAKAGEMLGGGRAEGMCRGRRTAVVAAEDAAGAVDGARDARGNGLVERDGAGGVMMGRRLVAVAGLLLPLPLPVSLPVALSLALSFTFSLALLVATGHVLVLLVDTMSLVRVTVSIVGSVTDADILAVHDDLGTTALATVLLDRWQQYGKAPECPGLRLFDTPGLARAVG